MVTVGLLVTLTAKPGKGAELAAFIRSAVAIAQPEPDTVVWLGYQIDDHTFGVILGFVGQAGRQSHLRAASALADKAAELLASAPDVKPIDILASKQG